MDSIILASYKAEIWRLETVVGSRGLSAAFLGTNAFRLSSS